MFTFRRIVSVVVLALLATTVLPEVSWADSSQVRFMETTGVSVSLIAVDSSETVIQPRGGVLVIDLRATVRIRNDGARPIRGISLGVWTGEATLGSKASVAVPGLYMEPGELFPLKLALRLLRPLPAPKESIVSIEVDGLLFDNFHFQGPDRLDSRRRLMVWTMQADRDREAMRKVLAAGGPEKLRGQVLARLVAQQQRPRLEARSLGRSVSTSMRNLAERRLTLAFSDIPKSPVGALAGSAFVAGRTARAPKVTVENRSSRAVQYFELGWVIDDALGRRSAAGSLPAPNSPIRLAPGQSIVTSADRRFSFWPVNEGENRNFLVKGIRGFITQVQFEDGSLWIPSREDLRQANLLELLPASPEEQRLTNLYRRRGLDGLIEELGRY